MFDAPSRPTVLLEFQQVFDEALAGVESSGVGGWWWWRLGAAGTVPALFAAGSAAPFDRQTRDHAAVKVTTPGR